VYRACTVKGNERGNPYLRGCLHVSESAYELPYDSVHDSLGNRIGIKKKLCHPLQSIVCLHISAKKNQKLPCWTPLAANRTPNRMGIRMGNRTCRQPLTHWGKQNVATYNDHIIRNGQAKYLIFVYMFIQY
jgi:hypothetical protein